MLTITGRKNVFKTIAWAGLIAGTLDAAGAIILFLARGGQNPLKIFQYIASAVFGKEAYSPSLEFAWWGILFHFIIAYAFTCLFFFLYPRIKILEKNIVVTGILYGIFIWLVMNLIVVPLTNARKFPFNLGQALLGAAILILAIGLPVAFIARRFYQKR